MPEDRSDDMGLETATALAEPPQPPRNPPTGLAAGDASRPKRQRAGVVVVIAVVVIAMILLGVVVALILQSRGGSKPDASASNAAFQSAMQKSGVNAQVPAQTVSLLSVKAQGSHPFSASFTPEEVSALLNAFPYEYDAAGMRIQLRDTILEIPLPGAVRLTSKVNANGGTYTGSVTLPATFVDGRIDTTGVTDLMVEGIPGNSGQKAQVGNALVAYLNAYLAAAPGLKVKSAVITASGFSVEGSAPDTLTYP